MKNTALFRFTMSLCFVASLILTVGCGGGGAESDSQSAEIAALEAKAAQGDGEAAFKLGELLANDSSEDSAKRVTALKWFYVAAKLGNQQASMGITTLEKTMSGDEIMTATRDAENFKVAQ